MKFTASLPAPELLLAAIVDSSEDAIVSKNLHSIITSWNKGAERIFGYDAAEMIGQSIGRLFPPDRLDEETHILARIQRGERVEHFETVRVRKDGAPIDVSLTISPIRNNAGEIIGASKIARDISEQKRSQRELAEAHEELQRVNQVKAEFLATLSHELRTPLSAIIGWVQMLKDAPSPQEVAEGVQVIERNVRMQSQLIEDLLDMSRIEAGKVSLDIQRLDLAVVVAAAMETVRPAAEAKGIRLTSAFSSVGGIVMGDKNRLQQIVWNLLTNAVKFTPKQERIHVTIKRAASQVEVSVTDTGQGIAPEFLGQIFERFRQGDASTTRRQGGLGLGLSIAKQLAELHGATLHAASLGLGQGSCFTLEIPIFSAHHSKVAPAAQQRPSNMDTGTRAADLTGVKVLVVDDEADCGAVICRLLERRGAEVRTATCMEDGLAEFTHFSPHLVLSDIGMPDHDGYEFIATLRQLPGASSVPVVALTALARTEDRTRALRAGFQLHLAKPVDADELAAVVQNLAALRRNTA